MDIYFDFQIARKTIIEMFTDRFYNMEEFYNEDRSINMLTINEIKNKMNEDHMEMKVGQDRKKCVLFYNDKIGVDIMKEIIKLMTENECNHLTLVVKQKITAFAKKELINMPENVFFEMFNLDELLYNVTRHKYVPKHILMNKLEDISDIHKTFGTRLPKILKTDPVSRYYNARPGNIFKIMRRSGVFYRTIV